MTSNICLHMLFYYIISLHIVSTLAHSDNYIIHMNLSAMPTIFLNQHSWYESTLSQVTPTNNNFKSTSSKIIYTYNNVMNGFSANLSPEEHEALKISPGYISSIPDLSLKLDTTHSPKFLGLNPYKGAWPASDFGKDVIVGVIDTGVWPESESFNDKGMTKMPSNWKGQLCQFENTNNSSLCNKKLIGARYFNKGFLAKYPNISRTIVNTTRDTSGHGTHTSSIAAGSRVDGASFFGFANGTAMGIASLSRVAMYKAVWGPNEDMVVSDIIAAIDTAISDGVDVLSMSFSYDNVPLYKDGIAIATFAAMEKGIFVSASAGNDGPSFNTMKSNGIPWETIVAASTLDREFHGNLTLGNGVSVTGFSIYPGKFSTSNFRIVFMGMCDNVKKLIKVKSKIVVCEFNNGTFDNLVKPIQNLIAAKVVGSVLITNTLQIDEFSLSSAIPFPSIIINPKNGEIVKDFIKRTSYSSSIAKMSFKITSFDVRPAPSVDIYSSRGPSKNCPYVLKPDITGPGTSILAAWPTNIPVFDFVSYKFFNKFNIASGTSMSCPHIAGVAALLKGAHGDWSPAAIRSAIMTTSDIFDNTKEHITDIGTGNKATPLALGAGHVNPNRALDPGLIYDAGVQDYVNLLCALNYTQKNIIAITRSSVNDCSKPSLDLNYPSFIAFFNAGNSSKTTQHFHRTVTNVGEGQTTYVASITPIKRFRINVIPNKLVFKKKNQKISYKLSIEGPRMIQKNKVSFGYLTWKDDKHVVRSPIVVTIPSFNL
ncbi:subtilisin-like protease SBT3 [Trifolium pratense]|uniref:subtilisin-like protease SBT3 n=1 Tax=Trifolium pratense TaxID=57577 RepID=UPI001E695B06|nr:subtilisin-like protease SBT3 [Trifolium pratense]